MHYLLVSMPNIVCESIAVDWERSAWRSGHGTPVNEMDFASTLRYQRYLNARLHRHRGVDMVLEAQARRDLWDRELRDRHVEYPDSTRPDALLPRFHLMSRPEHRELPFAQCAFATAIWPDTWRWPIFFEKFVGWKVGRAVRRNCSGT